jgi:hypothetical protein
MFKIRDATGRGSSMSIFASQGWSLCKASFEKFLENSMIFF